MSNKVLIAALVVVLAAGVALLAAALRGGEDTSTTLADLTGDNAEEPAPGTDDDQGPDDPGAGDEDGDDPGRDGADDAPSGNGDTDDEPGDGADDSDAAANGLEPVDLPENATESPVFEGGVAADYWSPLGTTAEIDPDLSLHAMLSLERDWREHDIPDDLRDRIVVHVQGRALRRVGPPASGAAVFDVNCAQQSCAAPSGGWSPGAIEELRDRDVTLWPLYFGLPHAGDDGARGYWSGWLYVVDTETWEVVAAPPPVVTEDDGERTLEDVQQSTRDRLWSTYQAVLRQAD